MNIEIFKNDCEVVEAGEVTHLICSTEFEGIDVAYNEADDYIMLSEELSRAKKNCIHFRTTGSLDDVEWLEEELRSLERNDKRFEDYPSYIIVCGDWQLIE